MAATGVAEIVLFLYEYIIAKQKHLGCKKVRGQSEAALQTGVTKNFDIS